MVTVVGVTGLAGSTSNQAAPLNLAAACSPDTIGGLSISDITGILQHAVVN
jgi:hypothetical protein